ncbi:polymorphic toxin type 44 domain-containing protein [Naumannella halotolerans]|uniref:polymorphic toxin type 44 domain-containing protein n=1 Tax=Naumannella halotolerans TaxID=993414 RepID=UPI002444C369|nr:polymorphic toxin type 44 domain-containing protein [Naumannella halotolerans]
MNWCAPVSGWDHKLKLERMTGTHRTGVPGGGRKALNYDVWSNIHYGYIGSVAGFSEKALSEGAASSLAGRDDAGDQLSIRIGVSLYRRYGAGGVSDAQLAAAIRENLTRPDWNDVDRNTSKVRPWNDLA